MLPNHHFKEENTQTYAYNYREVTEVWKVWVLSVVSMYHYCYTVSSSVPKNGYSLSLSFFFLLLNNCGKLCVCVFIFLYDSTEAFNNIHI